jgi:predicted Ser/Thr protein kinase
MVVRKMHEREPMGDTGPISTPLRSINGYEILELIASGGMSRVYRARNAEGRTVAVKVVQFDEMAADYERRLRREPEIQHGVGHDNIVRLLDWFRVGGEFFLVMEYIDGESLWRIVRTGGPLSFERARGYLRQILPAVGHLHELGIIHRDIKPANILIAGDGTAKLGDFGIAKFTWQQGQTRTQLGLGTPEYMSPEQARGVGIDWRTDIYSLGITFFEMLIGRTPFARAQETPEAYSEVIQGILSQSVPDPRSLRANVPSGAASLIARATAKDPRKRFASSAQMLRALDAIVDDTAGPTTVVIAAAGGHDDAGGTQRAASNDETARAHIADSDASRDAATDAFVVMPGSAPALAASDESAHGARATDGVAARMAPAQDGAMWQHGPMRAPASRPIWRRPVAIIAAVLVLIGVAFAATRLAPSPETSTEPIAIPQESPRAIAERIASSYGEYARTHLVEPLSALYATSGVRYLDRGVLGRDSIVALLREEYRDLARTDTFAVTVDSVATLDDSTIMVSWRASYARVRIDSTRFAGTTADRLRIARADARWAIVEHARRLVAGIAPDGHKPSTVAHRVASSAPKSSSSVRRSTPRASSSRSTTATTTRRKPIISVRLGKGIEIDLGPDHGKGAKAKKRRK